MSLVRNAGYEELDSRFRGNDSSVNGQTHLFANQRANNDRFRKNQKRRLAKTKRRFVVSMNRS